MRSLLDEVDDLTHEVAGILMALNGLRDRLATEGAAMKPMPPASPEPSIHANEPPAVDLKRAKPKRYVKVSEWRKIIAALLRENGPANMYRIKKATGCNSPSFAKACKGHEWFAKDEETGQWGLTAAGLQASQSVE